MDCPICQTSNIPESNKFCPTCGYDISPYPLVIGGIPQPFIDKEQQRVAWAKKLWADCQAKIASAKAASIQSQDQFNQQFNQIVSQVEKLTQVQTQLSQQLAELASANMSARLSEIEQQLKQKLEQRLENIVTSRLADLSATIEQQIIDKLNEPLSKEIEAISTAISQLEQQLNSPIAVSPPPKSTTPATSQPSAPNTKISLRTFSFTTVKVDDRGSIVTGERLQAEYFTEDLGNGVTLDMVAIPGGTFMMGSPETEKGRIGFLEIEKGRRGDEGPQHSVTVPAFFMAKYPVTQAQWQAVMGNNPSYFKGANRPVEQVSWNEAGEFCQKLSQITGKNYRLPSEAEWEYACRAGTATPFCFGETITTGLANYNGNGTYGNGPKGVYREQTTDVGSFPPNGFGLYDMHGNVSEWCQDAWHGNYNGAPTDGGAWTSEGDPDRRLPRGGSWYGYPWYCRSAFRAWNSPGDRYVYLGFRIAVSLPRT
jgi:formylglycine-generating enzyme required for sulfatase activity